MSNRLGSFGVGYRVSIFTGGKVPRQLLLLREQALLLAGEKTVATCSILCFCCRYLILFLSLSFRFTSKPVAACSVWATRRRVASSRTAQRPSTTWPGWILCAWHGWYGSTIARSPWCSRTARRRASTSERPAGSADRGWFGKRPK